MIVLVGKEDSCHSDEERSDKEESAFSSSAYDAVHRKQIPPAKNALRNDK
jgi:hypothetical protein